MFGIGTSEVLIILVVALLVIGPSKLPELARTLGKGLAEFRRVSSDVKNTIELEGERLEEAERKKKQESESLKQKSKAEDNNHENLKQDKTVETAEGLNEEQAETEQNLAEKQENSEAANNDLKGSSSSESSESSESSDRDSRRASLDEQDRGAGA